MPLDAVTTTLSSSTTTRRWVSVYLERPGAVLHGNDTPHTDDTPPTYDQVIGPDGGLPTYAQAAGQDASRRLPDSRAIPQNVANEPGASSSPSYAYAYAYASTAPEHPQVQARELNKLLKRIARNEIKLVKAHDIMLEDAVDRFVRHQVLRNFCGGGLFDDSASEDRSMAERNYLHYAKKLPKLQAEYAAMLQRP